MQRMIFMLLFAFSHNMHAQIRLPDCGIYITANDYRAGQILLPSGQQDIKLRQPVFHSHQVWIQTRDSIHKFGYDTIWGYRVENIDWRVYNGEAYEVKDTGTIWLYEFPVVSETGIIPSDYFSTNANAPVKTLNKNHLLESYYEDTAFVHRIAEVKHAASLFKRDKKTHHFYFEQWLKSP